MSWQARLPPAMNEFLGRLGVNVSECARADGRFTLYIEDCGHIDLVPVTAHRIVLDTSIIPVDANPVVRREQMLRGLQYAASRMRDSGEIVALSQDGDVFRLQAHLDSTLSPVEIEDAMDAYVQAIARWRAVLSAAAQETRPRTARVF